ncbi:MAG: hypothetical protein A2202_00880 [Bdellovibrionales bacterium RIFOXYA1_FULL_36_14]|nr:MAG: hypothetical protein A2202_00880 [Bdellovibrionales bacterium RIFOXYA1_FULL_36_14]
MKNRYLNNLIITDAIAAKKIAFVTGPRQVGKTTLCKQILEKLKASDSYYNWDDQDFRLVWIQSPKNLIEKKDIVVFDEIHKDRKWKNKLKGLFDLYGSKVNFIVSGSARLDYYRKSGDSLQGRYFPYHLHPFTLGETSSIKLPPQKNWLEHANTSDIAFDDLLNLGGFPEPLLGQSQNKATRWRNLYRERMVREDIRDLQNVRDLSMLDNLSLLLKTKIGSQLSYESLRKDLSVSFESILRWIDLYEAIYYCYRIRPYSNKIKNSIIKEPKLYLYDWSNLEEQGAKFENLIAGHLLKNVHLWTDGAMGDFKLYYLRDKQKREVDFFITNNNKPYLLLEVKSNQTALSPSLIHYNEILKPMFCLQLVREEKKERGASLLHPNIRVMHVNKFLSALN